MSYATIQSALATVLRNAASFDANNLVEGHFRPVASKSESVTLTPGGVAGRRRTGIQSGETDWVVNIQLFVKANRSNVEDLYADIISLRQELIDEVDHYPTLNGTAGVINAVIVDADEPDWLQAGRSYIWVQSLRCQVRERVTFTGGEYA